MWTPLFKVRVKKKRCVEFIKEKPCLTKMITLPQVVGKEKAKPGMLAIKLLGRVS